MSITSAELQSALGLNPMNAQVVQSFEPSIGIQQQWYVVGNADAPGKALLVTTTASDDAATQAAAVLAALRA